MSGMAPDGNVRQILVPVFAYTPQGAGGQPMFAPQMYACMMQRPNPPCRQMPATQAQQSNIPELPAPGNYLYPYNGSDITREPHYPSNPQWNRMCGIPNPNQPQYSSLSPGFQTYCPPPDPIPLFQSPPAMGVAVSPTSRFHHPDPHTYSVFRQHNREQFVPMRVREHPINLQEEWRYNQDELEFRDFPYGTVDENIPCIERSDVPNMTMENPLRVGENGQCNMNEGDQYVMCSRRRRHARVKNGTAGPATNRSSPDVGNAGSTTKIIQKSAVSKMTYPTLSQQREKRVESIPTQTVQLDKEIRTEQPLGNEMPTEELQPGIEMSGQKFQLEKENAAQKLQIEKQFLSQKFQPKKEILTQNKIAAVFLPCKSLTPAEKSCCEVEVLFSKRWDSMDKLSETLFELFLSEANLCCKTADHNLTWGRNETIYAAFKHTDTRNTARSREEKERPSTVSFERSKKSGRPSSGSGGSKKSERPSSGSGGSKKSERPSSGSGGSKKSERPSSGSGGSKRSERPSSGSRGSNKSAGSGKPNPLSGSGGSNKSLGFGRPHQPGGYAGSNKSNNGSKQLSPDRQQLSAGSRPLSAGSRQTAAGPWRLSVASPRLSGVSNRPSRAHQPPSGVPDKYGQRTEKLTEAQKIEKARNVAKDSWNNTTLEQLQKAGVQNSVCRKKCRVICSDMCLGMVGVPGPGSMAPPGFDGFTESDKSLDTNRNVKFSKPKPSKGVSEPSRSESQINMNASGKPSGVESWVTNDGRPLPDNVPLSERVIWNFKGKIPDPKRSESAMNVRRSPNFLHGGRRRRLGAVPSGHLTKPTVSMKIRKAHRLKHEDRVARRKKESEALLVINQTPKKSSTSLGKRSGKSRSTKKKSEGQEVKGKTSKTSDSKIEPLKKESLKKGEKGKDKQKQSSASGVPPNQKGTLPPEGIEGHSVQKTSGGKELLQLKKLSGEAPKSSISATETDGKQKVDSESEADGEPKAENWSPYRNTTLSSRNKQRDVSPKSRRRRRRSSKSGSVPTEDVPFSNFEKEPEDKDGSPRRSIDHFMYASRKIVHGQRMGHFYMHKSPEMWAGMPGYEPPPKGSIKGGRSDSNFPGSGSRFGMGSEQDSRYTMYNNNPWGSSPSPATDRWRAPSYPGANRWRAPSYHGDQWGAPPYAGSQWGAPPGAGSPWGAPSYPGRDQWGVPSYPGGNQGRSPSYPGINPYATSSINFSRYNYFKNTPPPSLKKSLSRSPWDFPSKANLLRYKYSTNRFEDLTPHEQMWLRLKTVDGPGGNPFYSKNPSNCSKFLLAYCQNRCNPNQPNFCSRYWATRTPSWFHCPCSTGCGTCGSANTQKVCGKNCETCVPDGPTPCVRWGMGHYSDCFCRQIKPKPPPDCPPPVIMWRTPDATPPRCYQKSCTPRIPVRKDKKIRCRKQPRCPPKSQRNKCVPQPPECESSSEERLPRDPKCIMECECCCCCCCSCCDCCSCPCPNPCALCQCNDNVFCFQSGNQTCCCRCRARYVG